VSAHDPGAANGQQTYPPMLRCVCGDLDVLHNLSTVGKRTGCSNSNCDCRAFTEAVASGSCVRCATPASALCCSSHKALLCHRCYRQTHFVEICVEGCPDCAREGLDVRLP